MEYYLCTLTLLLIGISAFFTSIVNYITLEELNNIIERNYKAAKYLQDLRIQFEENVVAFTILEFIFFSIFGLLLGIKIFSDFTIIQSILLLCLIFLAALIFRYSAQAFGMRNAVLYGEKLAPVIYYTAKLVSPLHFLLQFISMKIVGETNGDLSRDEINTVVESAHEDGSIDADEYRILKNIMNYSEVFVSDVMTPRTVLFSLDGNIKVKDAIEHQEFQMYSRIPIWEGESIDDSLLGYVLTKDIYKAALSNKKESKLRDFAREIATINEDESLDKALEAFLHKRQHLFIVDDEYGGVTGILTMEDVLETILGVEIIDEVDKFADLRHLAKQKRDERISSIR